MLVFIGALATIFNIIILIYKLRIGRKLDVVVDTIIFISLCGLFAGTIAGLQIGMIASMGVSLYLLAYPITKKDLSW